MQRRVPAVGDREQIAGDLGLGTLVVTHDDASELLPASRLLHHGACENRPWPGTLLLDALAPRIDHGSHGDAACREIARRGPAVIGAGEHNGSGAWHNGEAVEIAAHRRAQHHAGQIIAGKGNSALDGA